MSARTPLAAQAIEEVEYPSSDGEPMAETGIHVRLMTLLYILLRSYFENRIDVYVVANIFLFYEKGNPDARRSPDVMVIKGVSNTPERDSFKTWEEKAVPCFVIELTSKSTEDEDQGPKKELYERLGVREYFLFDPLNEYLPRPLVGYRLVPLANNGNGEDPTLTEVHHRYDELQPDSEGGIVSAELNLRLVPRGNELALLDPKTGVALPTPAEVIAQLKKSVSQRDQALGQRDQALGQRDQALGQRDQALSQRDETTKRNEQLERELADLRAQLAASKSSPPSQGT